MPITVYLFAAPRDEPAIDALATHVGALNCKRDGPESARVFITRESQIQPGTKQDASRKAQVEAADIIVLLLSAELLDGCHAELNLALDQQARGAIIVPVICRPCNWQQSALASFRIVPDERPVRSGKRIRETALTKITEEIRAHMPVACGVSDIQPGPFPGLEPFDEDRTRTFFGRDNEVVEALDKLAASFPHLRWLQVEGLSGSGKSSVVHAGIVPAIRAGNLDAELNQWVTIFMRPGHDPVHNLAAALVHCEKPRLALDGRTPDQVRAKLRESPNALSTLLKDARPNRQAILLVVDQLEEIFTLAHANPAAVNQFGTLLAAALDDPDKPLVLITTIRSDFVPRMAELATLRREQAVVYNLPPMSQAGLRAALEKPAEQAGLIYEEGLVNHILADAGSFPGALPLVAHVLETLYTNRTGRILTACAYNLSGGVSGALAKSADSVIKSFDEADQTRARKVLLRLVKSGRGNEDTRQIASREAVLEAAGGGAHAERADTERARVERVLARLSGGTTLRPDGTRYVPVRLVTVSYQAKTSTTSGGSHLKVDGRRVDLVHDALIRRWTTLRHWIDAERDRLELRDEVEDAARTWVASGSMQENLPKGTMLARFLRVDQAIVHKEAKDYLNAAKRKARRRTWGGVCLVVAIFWFVFVIVLSLTSIGLEQETKNLAQIRQANKINAAMVAGSVLSYLRSLSDAVHEVAESEELLWAIKKGENGAENAAELEDVCARAYERFGDLPGGVFQDSAAFDSFFIFDENGIGRARVLRQRLTTREVLNQPFGGRNYFKEAMTLGQKGLRATYVSNALRSRVDGLYRLGISAPIYGSNGKWKGVLLAGVTTTGSLGSAVLEDGRNTAVLAAPADPEDRITNDMGDLPEYVLFRHPALQSGRSRVLFDKQIRELGRDSQEQDNHVERWWQLPNSRWVGSSDSYEDPMGQDQRDGVTGDFFPAVPAYSGRRVAGFAPVGHTGMVVIVQANESDLLRPEKTLAERFVEPLARGLLPGLLLALLWAILDWKVK